MGVTCILLLAGCIPQQRMPIQQQLRLARAQSYRAWHDIREQREKSEAYLDGALSLEDALKLALLHNKSIHAILRDKEIAAALITKSYAEGLPAISLLAGYTRLEHESLRQLNNYSVDLDVRQPLFRGGAVKAGIRAAKIYTYLANENVRSVVQDTIFTVTHAYYDVLIAQHLWEVNRDAVRASETFLTDVTRKRKLGVTSEFDVLRAQVEVSNFKAEMIRQQNRINLEKARLLRAMGVRQDSSITLSDVFKHEPMMPDFAEAVGLAYENRPDLLKATLDVLLQEQALNVAQSDYRPDLDAFFVQGWGRPDPHNLAKHGWGDRREAGLILTWPLFDGFRRDGQLMQEDATLRKRIIELIDKQEGAQLDVQQAILTLNDADELIESQKLNLDRANEALRLAQVGYREGINTEVEVTDSTSALTRARGLHYQALYAHAIARLEFQQSTGILGLHERSIIRPEMDAEVAPVQDENVR